MEIRWLNDNDYEQSLAIWWKKWRWTPPPKDMLPGEGKGGFMVSSDGVDICAGFLYLTNSKTAWLEYIISNFDYKDKEKREEALNMLIETLIDLAKVNNIKYIYASLRSKSLIEKYEKNGFNKGNSGCQEMVMSL